MRYNSTMLTTFYRNTVSIAYYLISYCNFQGYPPRGSLVRVLLMANATFHDIYDALDHLINEKVRFILFIVSMLTIYITQMIILQLFSLYLFMSETLPYLCLVNWQNYLLNGFNLASECILHYVDHCSLKIHYWLILPCRLMYHDINRILSGYSRYLLAAQSLSNGPATGPLANEFADIEIKLRSLS